MPAKTDSKLAKPVIKTPGSIAISILLPDLEGTG